MLCHLKKTKQLKLPLSPLVEKLTTKRRDDFYPLFDESGKLYTLDADEIAWRIPCLELIVEPDSVMFFSSDVIHAGALWDRDYDNYRLHIYYGHTTHKIDAQNTVDTPPWCRHYLEDEANMLKTVPPNQITKDGNRFGRYSSIRRNDEAKHRAMMNMTHKPS